MIALCIKQHISTVYEDNMSTIIPATQNASTQGLIHVRARQQFVHENVSIIIKLVHCPTDKMTADMLTKPILEAVFSQQHRLYDGPDEQ